jgi:all-trans-retinol dehydrogenase (NAD+)
MSSFSNATVLITGGASGIGKLMGELVLRKGARTLLIWDRDQAGLDRVTAEFTAKGWSVFGQYVDVTDLAGIRSAAEEVRSKFGGVDFLFNNAGIVVGKVFEEHSHEEITRTMQVNADAPMHITLEFLPAMIRNGRGHIINIASAAGMTANPNMAVYVASKFSVVGWSESLRLELEKKPGNLHVTTVTPFYISTGMFHGVTSPIVPIVRPEKAAEKIIRDTEKEKIFCRMPGIVYAIPFFKGILPQRWFDLVVGKWFGIYRSMDAFKGRG